MKKLMIVVGCFALGLVACKKKYDDVSRVVTASYPTISFTGSQFYSIPVGGTAPNIQATAFDSVLNESASLEYDASVIDASTPGLYVVPMVAKNKNGYTSSTVVYVAVTDIADSFDLSGEYVREATGATANVVEEANGLYSTDNLFGSPSLFVTAYFVQIDESTIVMPEQPTDLGTLITADNALHLDDGTDPTYYEYSLQTLTSNGAVRRFVKQ